ncbi:helix-turn-helix domain-containing protein [Streptomyces sp. HNM0645]|uniref:helix-turn-helix transcriptional regulator n=1 Tax=Streptomyces sp. HNM0645 TaxID=2782343 RepID=UPI0024B7488C|nr:XRE family transcriptional regulator [Streptomyces sp. HNM0645]MDI9889005.1 helix-turn-helix domain-containing protein [Streptomyces sp. HNM0645]
MTDQLGPLLRRLRQRAGLTQEQLEERSGVSVRTIRRLETGKSGNHQLQTVRLLAQALDIGREEGRRLTDLLGRDGSGEEPFTAPPHTEPRPGPDPEPEPGPPPVRPPAVVDTAPGPAAPAAEQSPLAASLIEAADLLAGEVRRRWRREEEQRRVHDPFPLPVRWRPTARELGDHPENVQRLQPGATAGDMDLSGDVRSVAETYRRIESGRLVILGRAGSGKSVLAVRLALDLVASRAPLGRVPVIVSLGSWDPTTTTFRGLLVGRLLRDHPHLARRVPGGSTQAASLVDADLILPILDGFDEMAAELRGTALDELNTTSLPLVLTSRQEEYAGAVKAIEAPLVWAACVELTDLTHKDLMAYLPRTSRRVSHGRGGENRGVWDAVLDRLGQSEEGPGSGDAVACANLARVLRTPFMVVLARTTYSEAPGKDPSELLDADRFPTADHLEDHLLASFVPTVYRRRATQRTDDGRRQPDWDPDRARHWLACLAHGLSRSDCGGQDLAWWRLSGSLRPATRVLHVALISTLCMSMATWLVGLLAQLWGTTDLFGPRLLLLQGTLIGLLAGVAFGLVSAVMETFQRGALQPFRVRLRLPAADRRVERRPLRSFTARFGSMLLGGATLGVGYAWALALLRALSGGLPLSDPEVVRSALINMLAFGLIFGLTAGLVFGLLAAFEAPMDITAAATPIRLLSANRAEAGRQLLVLVPVLALGIALCGHLVVLVLQESLGPLSWQPTGALLIGSVGGLGGATAYVLAFTAWGRWATLTRVWLTLTRRLPWNVVAFVEDAHRRGVLRRTGAVYQFRHVRLQQHLADSFHPLSRRTTRRWRVRRGHGR